MTDKRLTIAEGGRLLNESNPPSDRFVYCVVGILTGRKLAAPFGEGEVAEQVYKKALRPADPRWPIIWTCEHEHESWDDAARCLQTALRANPQES